VLRDLERKINDEEFRIHKGTMILTELLLTQEKTTKGKVYSMHAPETECIAKGRPTKPYEFGVKTSLAVTLKSGSWSVRCHVPAIPTMVTRCRTSSTRWPKLTGKMPRRSHVDKGYKGHGVDPETCEVLISGEPQRKSRSP